MSSYKIATKCLQSGYQPKNGEPRVLPIYQSTTFKYDSSEEIAQLFDLTKAGHMYTRISNPTVEYVEQKIADLEGGVGAMCTSSGQAASLISVLNICKAGDNIVSLISVYGGTINLFAVTLKQMGIEARFITEEMTEEEINSQFDDRTRLVFGETLANPSLVVFDFERFSKIAHSHNVPLIIDNSFATPILCRPFEWGADIVTHSTSKYMDGHAQVVGGVIVDSGNFDWSVDDKYPELTTPDESYHGLIYTEAFKNAAYITKARTQLMRDLGSTPQPMAAFLLNMGLETLDLRIRKHSENALKIAQFLSQHDLIESVNYPGLKDNPYHERANKYLEKGLSSGVVSFVIKGGREKATVFMDSLELAKIVVHVADARTSVLHPASTTHRQLTDEQLDAAGISPGFIRFSVGIEDSDDIIADLKQALKKCGN
ncbi:MAG: O-acetylhomoserine aminocarboxypropyltransferase/cysteine synthase [Sphaerochaetaceae bacterium]|nr:O-acetylhomoserine aminocarboxypropyltransferase/cysteine synthase [Sphaerochaetaceae bacterium]